MNFEKFNPFKPEKTETLPNRRAEQIRLIPTPDIEEAIGRLGAVAKEISGEKNNLYLLEHFGREGTKEAIRATRKKLRILNESYPTLETELELLRVELETRNNK